eukprot:scpid77670/ scgid33350/ 
MYCMTHCVIQFHSNIIPFLFWSCRQRENQTLQQQAASPAGVGFKNGKTKPVQQPPAKIRPMHAVRITLRSTLSSYQRWTGAILTNVNVYISRCVEQRRKLSK